MATELNKYQFLAIRELSFMEYMTPETTKITTVADLGLVEDLMISWLIVRQTFQLRRSKL